MAIDLVVLVSLGPNMMTILASHFVAGLPKRHTSWCVFEGISKVFYLSKKNPTGMRTAHFHFPTSKEKNQLNSSIDFSLFPDIGRNVTCHLKFLPLGLP